MNASTVGNDFAHGAPQAAQLADNEAIAYRQVLQELVDLPFLAGSERRRLNRGSHLPRVSLLRKIQDRQPLILNMLRIFGYPQVSHGLYLAIP